MERKLLNLKTMAGVHVRAGPDRFLNSSKGVVTHKDLLTCKEDEFVRRCPGVTYAKHIKKRRGEEMIPTNSFILTFNSPTPPTQIKAGYVKFNVRPYVPTPMWCFKCHKFGHGREKCRRQEPICDKCGKEGHAADSCKNDPHCVNCQGDHAASDKVCPKYAEEQAILRYRAYNGGTFQQARAAVVLEVAKEQVTLGTRGVTRKRVSTPAKITSNESKQAQKNDNRYDTESDGDIDNIDSIWNVPRDFCRAGRRTGGTSPPRPVPRRQSSPSQQSILPSSPPPSQPPPRAPALEESDSGDMDTDLGSAFSADPGGCPLSPLVLTKETKYTDSPPSPEPTKAARGRRCKGLAGPPSGGLPGK
ncbi:nucleic-acid-binding protein from mobile element jockey [Elysia marginata]|uniref:Nucleic-acid-binding protein from mobile element jockey n=1 Tax=Elysia marginata TaxID=1093978 RepID=A0AAV4FNT3_9GAST|nr:nucleic-acid-binding protein from mobile element jockey [Elysia marginata]